MPTRGERESFLLALVGGAWSVGGVRVHGDFALHYGRRLRDGHRRHAGHDLFAVASGGLRFRGLALALDRAAVPRFALNAVALRDDAGGLDHRQIQLGLVLGDPGSMPLAPLPVALRLWICEQLSTPPVIMTGTTLPMRVLWQVLATVERDVRTGVPVGNS